MKVFLVGGCVRDALLGVDIKDRDFVVVGGSEKELFEQGFECVGQGFPVFLHPETKEEYALARREKKVGAGYTGFEFETSADVTLEEDLSRRDLTINAMALNGQTLVDPFGGALDLAQKVLRHTSDAFGEDPLRVVRLARFYARYHSLGFTVAPATMELASQMVDRGDLNELPDERFWLEIEKALSDPEPQYFFELLFELGALNKVEFFKTMFGSLGVNGTILASTMRLAQAVRVLDDPEFRVSVLAAWVAPSGDQVSFNTMRATQLYNSLQALTFMGSSPTTQEVLKFFVGARAFSEGGRAGDVVTAVAIWEKAHGVRFSPFSAVKLNSLLAEVRRVTSEPFQHLEGKAIGEAMTKARLDALWLEM